MGQPVLPAVVVIDPYMRELSALQPASQTTMRVPGLLIGLLGVCFALASAQPAGTGVISGTVLEASTDASTPEPVRKAVVTVTWHGTPRSWATTRTDSSGRFQFTGLPAGVYDLRANKAGIGIAIYGANSSRETGENITLAGGETRAGLKLRFIRSASISGSVAGPDGDPTANMAVTLLRTGRSNGKLILVRAGSAQTDDRGQYRITNVQPGQYYVFVDSPGPRAPASAQVVGPQFYGGARESKDSTVVSIHDGDHLSGIDFALIAETPVGIRVQVTGMPVEPPLPETADPRMRFWGRNPVQIMISPILPTPFWNNGAGARPPDYRYEFDALPPGKYRVRATANIENKTYSTAQFIDARAGVADVTLALAPPVEVKGQLKVEGPPAASKQPLHITLAPVGPNGESLGLYGNENQGAQVGPDGKFTIPQVAVGEYNLNINTIPRGGFLKSVRFGDDEVRFKPIEIKPGSEAALTVVVSMRGAKIQGEVDAAGGDAGRAGILVAPVGEFHDFARFYYSVSADDHGKFHLLGLAPGKYKIFALEKLSATGLRSPESADQLMALDGDYGRRSNWWRTGRWRRIPS